MNGEPIRPDDSFGPRSVCDSDSTGKYDNLSASLFDLLLSRFAKAVSGDFELFGQLAIPQDFQYVVPALHNRLGSKRLRVDFLANLESPL